MKHPRGETPIYNEDGYSNETIAICERCYGKFDLDDMCEEYAGCWLCYPCINEIEAREDAASWRNEKY